MAMRQKPRILGTFEFGELLERQLVATGMLDLIFTEQAESTLESFDGLHSIVYLTASGKIASLLVQDYAPFESRIIQFAIGMIELVGEPGKIAVYLHPPVDADMPRPMSVG
jgi:hypothetical protein